MARDRDTGDGEPYTDDEVDDVYEELEDAYDDYTSAPGGGGGGGGGEGPPAGIDVRAQVEWAGTVDNNGANGVRTARLGSRGERIDLAPVMAAVGRAKEAGRRAGEAGRQAAERGPLKSYRAQGWRAQLRQLMGVKRGAGAAERAGLAPSPETLRRWSKGEQAPSKANREKIAAAYDDLRNPSAERARTASEEAKAARAEAVAALTETLRGAYGVNVRFRDIENMRFR